MKFLRFSLLSGLLLGSITAAHAGASTGDYAPGELLIKVNPAKVALVNSFTAHAGGKIEHSYSALGWQRIKLSTSTSVEAALALYAKQPGVVAVEPNYQLHAMKAPNDPRYDELYGMAKINAATAWNVNTGSADVVVAVCDTGIKYDHPDLAANMWHNPKEIPNNGKDDDGDGVVDDVYGYDAYNLDGDPMDDNGHGTHCAGTIGAVGNNKVGVVGVNWKVKLMAIKILSADGITFDSEAIDGYEYAISQKKRGVNLRVISNSWGGLGKSLFMQEVMQEAADNGIVSICAAGNDTTNNDAKGTYPADYTVDGLVSVGATDEDDQPAEFSNYGAKKVDLFAPGVNILSTWIGSGGAAYNIISGTSMACPHVAGAAALLLAQAPGLTPADIKTRLRAAVDVLPQLGGFAISRGRLNLGKLLSGGIYTVQGTVFDASKKSMAGVSIFLNGSKTASDVTDIGGTYHIDGLAAGTYTVSATRPGWKFTPTVPSVTLSGTRYKAKIDFNGKNTAAVYTVSGTVYQLEGTVKKPLRGAQIYLRDSTDPLAMTDSTGKYKVTGLAAGTYYLYAKLEGYDLHGADQISLDGSAKVALPTKAPATATADFLAQTADFTSPLFSVRAPVDASSYAQGQLTRAFGTAYDPSGVSLIRFALGKVDDSGVAQTTSFYLWATKKWSTPVVEDGDALTTVPDGGFLDQHYDSVSVDWSVNLPVLDPGNYSFAGFPVDTVGNYPYIVTPVGFTVADSTVVTNYPVVTITAPNGSAPLAANVATNATGKATDTEGVDSVFVYLRRYDEQGNILGYYNFTTKTWDATNEDIGVYRTANGKGKTSFNWSVPLPPLGPGSYELGAFGRDTYGNEAPEDASADTLSAFSVAAAKKSSATATIVPSALAS